MNIYKPLTDNDEFYKLLTDVQNTKVLLEGKVLIAFLEYVFYICSPRVTKTDFMHSAYLAAKAFATINYHLPKP